MAVAEIEPEAAMAACPHDRQCVWEARPVSHPVRPVGRDVRAWKYAGQVAYEIFRTLACRGPLKPAELDGSGGAQSVLHRRDEDLSVRRNHRPGNRHAARRDRHVITTLAFERQCIAEARKQLPRPCARADHRMAARISAILAADSAHAARLNLNGGDAVAND